MRRILRTCLERTSLKRTSLKRTTPGLCALAIAALLVGSSAYGQTSSAASAASSQTALDILHQLSDKADVVFVGQVLAIRRPNDGVVEVEFRVDQAIRGRSVGTPYILREWTGLWTAGGQRYRVGQRLLMLLHAPSAAGMSSPVGGLDGAIPIRQGGTGTQPAHSPTAPQRPFVDLRWLGARLPHAVSYRNEPAHAAKPDGQQAALLTELAAPLTQPTALVTESGSVISAAPITAMLGNTSASDASVPAQQASVDAVMGMLTTWQKAQHVAQ